MLWDFIWAQLSQVSVNEKETNIGTAGEIRIDKTGKAISCTPSVGMGLASTSLAHVEALLGRQSKNNREVFEVVVLVSEVTALGGGGKVGGAEGKGLPGVTSMRRGRSGPMLDTAGSSQLWWTCCRVQLSPSAKMVVPWGKPI